MVSDQAFTEGDIYDFMKLTTMSRIYGYKFSGSWHGQNLQVGPTRILFYFILLEITSKFGLSLFEDFFFVAYCDTTWVHDQMAFRWDLQLPKMVQGSISIMADTGQAMTMFSLGMSYGNYL